MKSNKETRNWKPFTISEKSLESAPAIYLGGQNTEDRNQEVTIDPIDWSIAHGGYFGVPGSGKQIRFKPESEEDI